MPLRLSTSPGVQLCFRTADTRSIWLLVYKIGSDRLWHIRRASSICTTCACPFKGSETERNIYFGPQVHKVHKYTYFEKLLANVEATFTFVQVEHQVAPTYERQAMTAGATPLAKVNTGNRLLKVTGVYKDIWFNFRVCWNTLLLSKRPEICDRARQAKRGAELSQRQSW